MESLSVYVIINSSLSRGDWGDNLNCTHHCSWESCCWLVGGVCGEMRDQGNGWESEGGEGESGQEVGEGDGVAHHR